MKHQEILCEVLFGPFRAQGNGLCRLQYSLRATMRRQLESMVPSARGLGVNEIPGTLSSRVPWGGRLEAGHSIPADTKVLYAQGRDLLL